MSFYGGIVTVMETTCFMVFFFFLDWLILAGQSHFYVDMAIPAAFSSVFQRIQNLYQTPSFAKSEKPDGHAQRLPHALLASMWNACLSARVLREQGRG